MRITEKYTFFYGTNDIYSNFHPAPFVDDVLELGLIKQSFPDSEHYFMLCKALYFHDIRTAKRIITAETPAIAKALGRVVTNFNKEVWDAASREWMELACYLKFSQNPELLKQLLSTKGTILVEASPTDTLWGVGMNYYDDRILDPANWRGKNWLGEVLTALRDRYLSGLLNTKYPISPSST
jgi:hypothetical protein